MSDATVFLLLMVPGTFFLGLHDVFVRRALRRDAFHPQFLLSLNSLGTACALFIPLLFSRAPVVRPEFFGAFAGSVVLNIFAQWAWFSAFRREEASLVSPLRLLTVPLVLFTGLLFLGERPSLVGIAGVLVTFAGLWLLFTAGSGAQGAVRFGALRRPGVLLGLFGAVSFAFSFPLDKQAVVASSALFYTALAHVAIGIGSFCIGWVRHWRKRDFARGASAGWKMIADMAAVYAAGAFLTAAALPYALAAYAASAKRLWSLWAVLLSGAFLKEGRIGVRLAATAVMLGGIALTALFG